MRFDIILADPPWTFETWSKKGKGRSPEQHYPCLTFEDICALPVKDIAADNCALFLWVTGPILPRVCEVITAWEFTYSGVAFTWAKRTKRDRGWHMGGGYTTRKNSELCLLATRGKPKRLSCAVRELVVAPVREHSQKPEEVRDRIIQLYGDLSRVELFARETTSGWVALGNEIDGEDIRTALPELARR